MRLVILIINWFHDSQYSNTLFTMSTKTQVAVLMLQPKCNMVCSFCVTENSMGSFEFSQAVELLETLKSESVKTVVFGGGEPFLWRHNLIELTLKAKQLGFTVQVGTNAILLPLGFENISSIDRWVLPLDGASREIHNSLRFFKNEHFDIILKRMQSLAKANRAITISTVITQKNEFDILNIAELLKNFQIENKNIYAWHLYQFLPQGRDGAKNAHILELPEARYNIICESVKKLNLPFKVFKRTNMLQSKTVEFFWMEQEKLHRQIGNELKTQSDHLFNLDHVI